MRLIRLVMPMGNGFEKVKIAPDEEKAIIREVKSTPLKLTFKDVMFEVTTKLSRAEAKAKGVSTVKN